MQLQPYESRHVYHITDTFDHRARGKIDGAYSLHRGRIGIRDAGYSFVPAVNTIDIGISASEFITNSQRPNQLIIAVNCAPPDNEAGTTNNARNDFFCAQLAGNVTMAGTSNGYEFSYVKGEIRELYRLTNTNSLGSQFRSLEILPEHNLLFAVPEIRARLIADGILKREENVDDIVPTVPDRTHVHEVDNFLNVKLLPSQSDLELLRVLEGKEVRFHFGGASIEAVNWEGQISKGKKAIVAPTLFAAPLGTNVLARRSSSQLLRRQGITDTNVPIIATIRQHPAETKPKYPVPPVGAPVFLRPKGEQLAA